MKRTNTFMAIIVCLTMTIFQFGCKKDESANIPKQQKLTQIKENAELVSKMHNDLIMRYIENVDRIIPVKEDTIGAEEMVSIIECLTGVNITIIEDASQINDNCTVLNLDSIIDDELLKMANYSTTILVENYFNSVDCILESDTLSLQETITLLDTIENVILNDNEASDDEIQVLLNGIEVPKGSLTLWDTLGYDGSKANPTSWPRWKKILFVAGCDAIGAVVGYFIGGFVTYMGVTYYIPPTTGGAYVTACVFSLFGARRVGWNVS